MSVSREARSLALLLQHFKQSVIYSVTDLVNVAKLRLPREFWTKFGWFQSSEVAGTAFSYSATLTYVSISPLLVQCSRDTQIANNSWFWCKRPQQFECRDKAAK
jgi:hypothetical protein